MDKKLKYVLITVAAIPLAAGVIGALADEARGGQGSGNAGTVRVTSSPSETRPASPKPDPSPARSATPAARSSQEDGQAALTQLSLELSWSGSSQTSRDEACTAWRLDRYTALEAFMEGAGSSRASMDSPTVVKFFDQHCAGGS